MRFGSFLSLPLYSAPTPKTLVLNGFPHRPRSVRMHADFGASHAPWRKADEFMESLPIQIASVAAPEMPASTPVGGTVGATGSFASTFGRALATLTDADPDGPAGLPKTPPRGKPQTSDASAAVSVDGLCLNSNVPPVPLTPPGDDAPQTIAGHVTPVSQSNAESVPQVESHLSGLPTATGGGVALPSSGITASDLAQAGVSTWLALNTGTAVPPSAFAGAVAASSAKDESSTPGTDGDSSGGYPGRLPAGPLPSPNSLTPTISNVPAWLPAADIPAQSPVGKQSGAQATSDSAHIQEPRDGTQSVAGEGRKSRIPAGLLPARSAKGRLPQQISQNVPVSGQTASSIHGLSGFPWEATKASAAPGDAPTVVASGNPSPSAVKPDPPGAVTASNPPELATRAGQTSPPTSDSNAGSAATLPSASAQPGLMEVSDLLGKFANAEMNVKVITPESGQNLAPDISTSAETTAPLGALKESNQIPTVTSVPVLPTSSSDPLTVGGKTEIPAAIRGTSRAVGVRASVWGAATAANLADQGEATAAPEPPTAAIPVPASNINANSLSPTAPEPLHKGAAPEQRGAPAGGGVSTAASSTSDAGASVGLPGEQGRTSQPPGPRPGDKPDSATNIGSVPANSFTGDANPIAAHAPSVVIDHNAAPTPQAPPAHSQPAATLSAWQSYDGGAGKIVRSASLTDSAAGAEMHVELRAGALGAVEIHTVVHEGAVGTEIHVQGQEAHALLASGLPSLERALAERNLRVENVSVYQDQTGRGMSGGQEHGQQSGSSPSPPRQSLPWDSPLQTSSPVTGSMEDDESTNPATGLSVQA